MIILVRQVAPEREASQVVLLFGVGLIGTSILDRLVKASRSTWRTLPFSWATPASRPSETMAIEEAFADAIGRGGSGPPVTRVDVVWAAGRGGFGSSEEQLAPELDAFSEVLALTGRLVERGLSAMWSFHLVSSAGGLFEGQRYIDGESLPQPLRPYGHAKREQERRLSELPELVRSFIYRPSSVYGYTRSGRAGLVAVLMQNAIANRPTRIFGSPNTLRDYVLSDDVGTFVAQRVTGGDDGRRTFMLASGKPTSMLEIIGLVQARMRRRLYLQFDPAPSNAMHNSVRPSCLPAGWRPTPLPIGVSRTAVRIENAFTSP